MEVNAVVYEYTGFGESNGKIPIDQSLYDDIETVYIYLKMQNSLKMHSDYCVIFFATKF